MKRTTLQSYKKIIILILLPLVWLLTVKINYIRDCDIISLSSYTKTPDGSSIQKYNQTIDFKHYGELTKHCTSEINSECFNVKLKGETVSRQIQLSVMRMLAIIDSICRKHKIEYFMVSGTLLGAYRGQKSIPWDDDADIGMLSSEFLRFSKVVRAELPKDISFLMKTEDPLNAHKKRLCIAKIRDLNTCYGYCLRRGCEWDDGIQIDIFQFHVKEESTENAYLYDDSELVGKNMPVSYVIPTVPMKLEGIMLRAPKDTPKALSYMFNGDFTKVPSLTCSKKGFVGIPWYGCKHIQSLKVDEQNEIMSNTMIHGSLFYWYF